MAVSIQNGRSDDGSRVPAPLVRELARRIRRACATLALDPRQVRVRILGARAMASLKEQHLGEAEVTDVLAFPHEDGGGDVALCWPVVCATAPADLSDEAARLAVHALVHLTGHDHHQRGASRLMLARERKVLRRLGVPDVPRPYDERGGRG